MTDTKELRRLAQAATPGPWVVVGNLTKYVEARLVGGLIQEVAACGPTMADEGYGQQQEANARLIAAANPAAIIELLDRLEAAEKERDALRVKVEQMEHQEPVAKVRVHQTGGNAGLAWSVAPLNDFDSLPLMRDGDRLYALPGAQAQPAPSAPNGWLRVIDEALVVAHLGVANSNDTYEQARVKLDNLISFYTDVATDPAVNGGWKLVPIAAPEAKP